MKQKLLLSLCSICCLFAVQPAFSQANSVELRNATTLLSSHATIADAYAAIPATITQPYIIEITATYTAATEVVPVTFTTRVGASATNTITLRPKAGVMAVNLVTSLTGNSIIILDNTDFMIIDGRPGGTGTTGVVTIGNIATASNSNTITLINGATNNIIRNLNLANGTSTNTGRNINLGASASNTTGNSDNRFLFITSTGGRYNINSNGTAANPNTRNRFYGCDVVNGAFAGIWYQAGTAKMTIDSCRIYHTSAVGDGPYGILFDSQNDTVIISRNKIYDLDNGTKTSAVRGISVRSTLSTGVNLTRIHNNFIALSGNASSTSVIALEYAGSSTTNANIYFNSIRVGGTLTSGGTSGNVGSAAFSKTATGASSVYNIKNNLFVNERSGGTTGLQHLAMSLSSTAGTINGDFNTYNATSTNLVRAGANLYTTIAAYQAVAGAGNEANSNSTAVQFVSATDLHLAGTSVGNTTLLGQPIAGITVDIDNQLRGTSTYRGADEANPITAGPTISSTLNNRAGVKATVEQNFNVTTTAATSGGQLVRIKITLANSAQAANISLSYEATPGNFLPLTFDAAGVALFGPVTGFPLANATTAFKATFNAPGTYNYSLAIIDAGTGSNLIAPTAESVTVGAFVPATISSNLNGRANVVTNRQENFVVTTVANDNAGRQVKGKITLTNPSQAANITMSYETSTPGTFSPLVFNASGEANFGPIPGFTLASGTTNFRAVFNAPGTYGYTISLVDATTGTLVGTAASESVTILVNGLKEELLAQAISLYPNPAVSRLTVKLPSMKNAELLVLDLTGKQILNAKPGTGETSFNLESLPSGTYLLQVKTEDAVASKRFVVIR